MRLLGHALLPRLPPCIQMACQEEEAEGGEGNKQTIVAQDQT